MRHSLKLIGASALALTLSFDGFGVWKDIGRSLGRTQTPASAASVAFAPAVRSDAALSVVVGIDKEQLWRLAETFLDKLIAATGDADGELKAAKAELAEYKKNPFKDLPPGDVASFLKESGVLDADYRWAVLSMDSIPDMNGGSDGIPDGLSLAIAGNIDLAKFMQAAQRKLAEKEEDAATFTETPLEGEKVWRLVPANEKAAQEMKNVKADPYVAWLGGQLVVMTLSRETMLKQIRLYRKGEGMDAALHGGDVAGATAYAFMSGIGKMVRQGVPAENLESLKAMLPNGDKIILGLKAAELRIQAASGESVQASLTVHAASEQDADPLRTVAKAGLMTARAQLAQQPGTPKAVLRAMESLKVGGANGAVELSFTSTVSDLVAVLASVMSEMTGGQDGGAGQAKPMQKNDSLK